MNYFSNENIIVLVFIEAILFMGGSQSSRTIRAARRIQNEKKQIQENPPVNWKVISNSWNKWEVWITTDINTPFHSIPFLLIVKFPDQYPETKPIITLENYQKFFHPNIDNQTGIICQRSIFHVSQPEVRTRQRIDAFINLLATPNPYSPLNTKAAEMLRPLKQNNPNEIQKRYNQYYKRALHIFRGIRKQ